MTIEDVLKLKEQEYKRLSDERDALKTQMENPSKINENLDNLARVDKQLEFIQTMQENAEGSNDQDYESNLQEYRSSFRQQLDDARTREDRIDMAFMVSTVDTLWHERLSLSEQMKRDQSVRESDTGESAEQNQQSEQTQETAGSTSEIEQQRNQQRQQLRQRLEEEVRKDDHDHDDNDHGGDANKPTLQHDYDGDVEMPSFLDDVD